MTRRRSPAEVSASRIDQAAARPHPHLAGERLSDDAILANPQPQGTHEQRMRDEKNQAATERKAAVQICDRTVADGCGGAVTKDNPEGCTSPDHPAHVASVIELWQMTGLTEAGKIAEKFREAS